MSANAQTAGRLPADAISGVRAKFAPRGTRLVIWSLAALLLVRFFTEVVHVLPRSATFIDVPTFLLLVTAAAVRGGTIQPSRTYFVPGLAFLAIAVVSAVTNPSRVAPAPVILFLYDFLAPLGIYYAVYRLWTPGNSLALSRLIVALGVVQFLVVGGIELPRFLSTHNPDLISGTFGDNAYQLVFFLIVLTALLGAINVFEGRRAAARFAPVMFVAIATIIFLAQYRALVVTTILSVIVIAYFLARARPGRGLAIGAVAVVGFLGSLNYVASHFPSTKLTQATNAFQSNPWFFVSARLHAFIDVVDLYSSSPRFIVTGTGPGTFSSRAWRTFADLSNTRTAVATPYAKLLNGGHAYETDVADKYTIPRIQSAPIVQGSHALTSPLSSYSSLLAEVGLIGFLVYVGIYVMALVHSGSLFMRALRHSVPGDPLPALLLACTIAFFVLLQLAALDNWLEVTRITFLSWTLLAVVTREIDARSPRQ